MNGARPAQLVTGGFTRHEPKKAQNIRHGNEGTNGLEIDTRQFLPSSQYD